MMWGTTILGNPQMKSHETMGNILTIQLVIAGFHGPMAPMSSVTFT